MPPNSSRPDPAAKTTQRSGIGPNSGSSGNGPKRALERPHPEPRRAAARKPNRPQRSLRAEDRSRGPNRPAEREWSAASLGGEQQIPKSAQRESSFFPRAYSASAGPFPRSTTSSGAGTVRSEPWRRTANPQKRTARKLLLPQRDRKSTRLNSSHP